MLEDSDGYIYSVERYQEHDEFVLYSYFKMLAEELHFRNKRLEKGKTDRKHKLRISQKITGYFTVSIPPRILLYGLKKISITHLLLVD